VIGVLGSGKSTRRDHGSPQAEPASSVAFSPHHTIRFRASSSPHH
jgi:hypothetical protein